MKRLPAAALIFAAGVGALVAGVGAQSSTSAPSRTVTCDEIILAVRSGSASGYRVVLGVFSVPRAYLPQVVRTRDRRWPYTSKAGLVIREGPGRPVVVSVPERWRDRAGFRWGDVPGVYSSLRFARCPQTATGKDWNAYAGGFYLRSRSACVPLRFAVGRRSATVRFGLGRRCGVDQRRAAAGALE